LEKLKRERLQSAEDVFMSELPRIIPHVQMLLALTPEELAEKDALSFEEAKRCEPSPR
jgi:hypothetical protein